MASSYADRLKARRGGGIQKKKPKELKLNATKRVRGKLVYWNPYTKSWSKTKVVKKVEVKKEQPLTRAEKLKKGMATWNTKKGNEAIGTKLPGSKLVKKTETPKTDPPKTEVKKTDPPKTEVKKTEKKSEKLKIPKGSARNWIRDAKGKRHRRGTPMAKRAEERERKRKALAAKGYMKNR